MALNKIKNNASWGESASSLNSNFESIEADLTKVKNATTRCKGYFISGDELKTAYPSAHVGDYAYIGTAYPFYIWKWNGSSWGNTGNTGGDQDVNLDNYYNKTETDAKLSELGSEVSTLVLNILRLEQGSINSEDGVIYESNKRVRIKDYIKGNFSVTATDGFLISSVFYYDETSKAFSSYEKIEKKTVNIGKDGSVARVVFRKDDGTAFTPQDIAQIDSIYIIDKAISVINEDIDEIKSNSMSLYNFEWVEASYISSKGVITAASSLQVRRTLPYQVKPTDIIAFKGSGGGYAALSQYDRANDTYNVLETWENSEKEIIYQVAEDMEFAVSGIIENIRIITHDTSRGFVTVGDIANSTGNSTTKVVSQKFLSGYIQPIAIDFVKGYYLTKDKQIGDVVDITTPTKASSTPWSYAVIEVNTGDIVTINGTGASTIRQWYELDENKVVLALSSAGVSLSNYNKKITNPQTRFLVIQDNAENYNSFHFSINSIGAINNRLNGIEEAVDELEKVNKGEVPTYNLHVRKSVESSSVGSAISLISNVKRALLIAEPPFRVQLEDGYVIRTARYVKDNIVVQDIKNGTSREIFIEPLNDEYDSCCLIINKDDESEILETDNVIKSIRSYKGGYYEDYSEGAIPIMFNFKEVKNGGLNVTENNVSNAIRHSDNWLRSYGVIYLPKSYSAKGNKTRLIIFAHGSGYPYPTIQLAPDYMPYVEYLLKEGYAVADCWSWGSIDGIKGKGEQFYCCPENYACYSAFYQHLIDHFNLHEDVFIFGKSLGGLQVVSLPYVTSIPVIACCLMSCQTSPLLNLWGYTDTDRMACLESFGCSGLEKDSEGNYIGEAKCMLTDYYTDGTSRTALTQERLAYLKKNADILSSFTPFLIREIELDFDTVLNNRSASVENYLALNPKMVAMKPIIGFVAERDSAITLATEKYIRTCRKNGGIGIIRYVPDSHCTDPHHAVDTESVTIDVVTKLGGTVSGVPISYAEMVDFFRSFAE